MTEIEDPRRKVTRELALDAALKILLDEGVLAVSHASVSKMTGISRSTLYRHWPEIKQLRNHAFKRASRPSTITPQTDGPLHADLTWVLSRLVSVLNDMPWGKIAPHVIAAAATDDDAKHVINEVMQERMVVVREIFEAAQARGEVQREAPIDNLVNMAIAVPYFRKLIAGLPLSPEWLETHISTVCSSAKSKL